MVSGLTVKQVTQRLRDGKIEVLDVPPPSLRAEGVLVDIRASLLSAGTERSKVETARQSLIGKARSRPDQVKQVVDKARRDGFRETVQAVRTRLDQPSGLGYSAAGVVIEVGSRVTDLAPGERVACGGGDYAMHAEVDYVPGNLCVRVPDGLDFDQAAFATVGSIALHGVRQADVRLGERVAVIGLGLVGQLAGQLLRASGCSVVGIDLAADLTERALEIGAADVAYEREGVGDATLPADARDCDAVIITAATKSSDPVELAARLCRDRGRVVVVGDIGMEIPRAPYYEKEIELRLSRSYGPGRYDRQYEERGLDYPIGYVRWTERRNMAAFLDLMAKGKVNVDELISDRIPVEEASEAYERLVSADPSPLGILIQYPSTEAVRIPQNGAGQLKMWRRTESPDNPLSVGVIGSGSFAQRILIPGLKDAGFNLAAVASKSGLSARATAERFGFTRAVTAQEVIADHEVGLVVIATRHDSHAELAVAALRAGKNVFVEKPPCLTFEELKDLRSAKAESGRILTVGFNRRHAPLAQKLREHVAEREGSLEIVYRVNTSPVRPDHWLKNPQEGGGQLVGEGCHFVDFVCWLVGALPKRVSCVMDAQSGVPLVAAERFSVVLDFDDGSMATILYGEGGADGLGKEYVEAHTGGRSGVLSDFRSLLLYNGHRRRRERMSPDKGYRQQLIELRTSLESGDGQSPPLALETMAATLAACQAGTTGNIVSMGDFSWRRSER